MLFCTFIYDVYSDIFFFLIDSYTYIAGKPRLNVCLKAEGSMQQSSADVDNKSHSTFPRVQISVHTSAVCSLHVFMYVHNIVGMHWLIDVCFQRLVHSQKQASRCQ